MRIRYQSPLADISALQSEGIVCASGGNEDFGHKPGTYDLLDPSNSNTFSF